MLKTKTKKKICMILIVSMLFSILPVNAFAEENSTVISGSCGENTTWEIDCTTGRLILAGEGAVTDYEWERALKLNDVEIIEVVIGAGITGFGDNKYWSDNPFAGYASLQNFTVEKENARFIAEDGVLFDTKFERRDYSNNIGMWSIAEGVYEKELVAYPAKKILDEKDGKYIVPNDVYSIASGAFSSANLKEIVLEEISGDSNLYMLGNNVFADCLNLKELRIPDGVHVLGSVGSCGLEKIEIGCSVAALGDYYILDNQRYYNPFSGCLALEEIIIESNNHYTVVDGVLFDKNMEILYYYPMNKIDTSYTIPDTVTTIVRDAFWMSGNLQQLTYGSSVKESGEIATTGLCNLSKLKLNDGLQSFSASILAGSRISNLQIPASVNKLTNIDELHDYDPDAKKYCLYFYGNAPEIDSYGCENVKIFYIEDKEGWTTPTWNGYPTEVWDGVYDALEIENITPALGSYDVPCDSKISIRFSHPVTYEPSDGKKIVLLDDNKEIEYTWKYGNKQHTVLRFIPKVPFSKKTECSLFIPADTIISNKNYETIPEQTFEFFTGSRVDSLLSDLALMQHYPDELSQSGIEEKEDQMLNAYEAVIDEFDDKDDKVMSYFYALKNAVGSITDLVFGMSERRHKELEDQAILSLMKELNEEFNTLNEADSEYVQELKETQEMFKHVDWASNLSYSQVLRDAISNIYGPDYVDDIIPVFSKLKSEIFSLGENSISAARLTQTIALVASMDYQLSQKLYDKIDSCFRMHDALERFMANQRTGSYLILKYVEDETVYKLIEEAAAGLASQGVVPAANLVLNAVNGIYRLNGGVDVEDMVESLALYDCFRALDSAVLEKKADILQKGTSVTIDDVEEYEMLYRSKLTCLRLCLEAAEKLATNKAMGDNGEKRETVQGYIDELEDGIYSYDVYLTECKKAALNQHVETYEYELTKENETAIITNLKSGANAQVYRLQRAAEPKLRFLPSKLDGYPVTGIKPGALDSDTSTTILVIPNTVEKIESNTFSACKNLEMIIMSENTKIDNGAVSESTVILSGFESKAKTIKQLEIKSLPDKQTYTICEEFDATGLTLLADGETVTEGWIITCDLSQAGTSIANVYYLNQSVSFPITVKEKTDDSSSDDTDKDEENKDDGDLKDEDVKDEDQQNPSSSSGGGFSGVYNYPIKVDKVDGAEIVLSDEYASKGEDVSILVKPDAGKEVGEVTVTDARGNVLSVTKTADNQYSFTMPSGKVNVQVNVKDAEYDLRIVMQIQNKNILAGDKTIVNDVAPVIVDDRTLVPIRVVTELLGGSAHWDAATRTVTLIIDGKVLSMTIDKPIPGFGTSAVIMNSRTYVPVRYVMEALGADVEWISPSRQIVIEK